MSQWPPFEPSAFEQPKAIHLARSRERRQRNILRRRYEKYKAFAAGFSIGIGLWLVWSVITADGSAAVGLRLRSVLIGLFVLSLWVPVYVWVRTGDSK